MQVLGSDARIGSLFKGNRCIKILMLKRNFTHSSEATPKVGEARITPISGRWLKGRLTVASTNRKTGRGSDLRMKKALMKLELKVTADPKGIAVNGSLTWNKPDSCFL